MGKTRRDLIASHPYGAIKKALPNVADCIANVIKPYEGGDYHLWEIGKLDNLDKHQLILPIVSIQALTGVNFEDENHNTFTDMIIVVGEGGSLRAIQTTTKVKITSYGKPTADMFFGKGAVSEGKAVIPSLLEFAEFTLEAIKTLEKLHFGQVTDPNTVKPEF